MQKRRIHGAGKLGKLTEEDLAAFLSTDVLCRLGVLDEDGWPYVVPVWFLYKDGGFYIIPRERSDWAGSWRTTSGSTSTIDEPGSLRKVLVKGEAELSSGRMSAANGSRSRTRCPIAISGRMVRLSRSDTHRAALALFREADPMKTWQGVDWAKRYKHETWGVS